MAIVICPHPYIFDKKTGEAKINPAYIKHIRGIRLQWTLLITGVMIGLVMIIGFAISEIYLKMF